ncbi:MAG: response regulator [Chitinivibrionales bacterium]|nr:response regulator [Chitinivibrionales bacterium]
MNILIVDDSKMIRHMVCTALKELGYDSVSEAAGVAEAKNLIVGKNFDLIISDWHMPGESGLDFLKYVKSRPEYAKLPFVLQTTENEKKNIIEAVKAGVSGYLIKPVEKKAIAAKLLELSKVYNIQIPSIAKAAPPPKPAEVAPQKETGQPGEAAKEVASDKS